MRTELAFSTDDLARTRFAVSPMWEVVTSLRVLAHRAVPALHRPWAAQVRRAAELGRDARVGAGTQVGAGTRADRVAEATGPALQRLAALVPAAGHLPDFLTPVPAGAAPALAEELAMIAATPPDLVRADLDILAAERGGRLPAVLEPLHRDPADRLPHLVADIEAYWEFALEPHWTRIRALLDADVLHRARQAAGRGSARVLDDLHETVHWDGGALRLEQRHCAVQRLDAGAGLVLVPSVFAWPRVLTRTLPPDPPQLAYPARGVATLWESGPVADPAEALAAVLGRSRARLLAELDAPASTTELARRTGLSTAGTSQHLTALRAAGLTSARRAGHAVLHARTAVADALLAVDAAGRTG